MATPETPFLSMKVTVKLEGEYLVFYNNGREIYDTDIFTFHEKKQYLRLKMWFTPTLEAECNSLIGG